MSSESSLSSSPTSSSSETQTSSGLYYSDLNNSPIENEPGSRIRTCQYVQRVVEFSSQYGSDTSISYTAFNIIGRQTKYPDYGDFPETFAMVEIELNL